MFLDLLFYSTYKKIEKSGERSLLVLNTCVFLSLVLTFNLFTLLVVLELLGVDLLSNIEPIFGALILAVFAVLLTALFLINDRFKKVLKRYDKQEINIEWYSIGYYFLSALALIGISMIKYLIA